jgi:glycosyltransferase involved in cell wall biosynthesis
MARGLADRGIRVRAITAHPHYPEWEVSPGYGQWSRRELLDSVGVHRLRHYIPKPPNGLRRLLSELTFGVRAAAARWGSPDALVFVSPALFSSCVAMLRARLLSPRTPTVVWVQDLYSLGLTETGQGSGLVGRVTHAAEGWLLRGSDKVVVIHDRFARRVAQDFALDPARIEVVRNWTHLSPGLEIDRSTARAAFGWGDETVVLHAGNMGVKQGLENVIEAARLADERNDNVRFVLLGGGGERDRLRTLGANVSRLQFIDPLPDDQFSQALAASDVLLVNEMPGVSEMAVPSKLTSYFSTGRPVLAATDEAGITAEEIRSAQAGVVIPAGAPAALLDGALELGGSPEFAETLGANGKRYRETVLDETFAIDRFASLLSLLINAGSDRPEVQTASVDPTNGARP